MKLHDLSIVVVLILSILAAILGFEFMPKEEDPDINIEIEINIDQQEKEERVNELHVVKGGD